MSESRVFLSSLSEAEDQEIDYIKEALEYEEQENWSMAIYQYEQFYKQEQKSETIFRLSQLNAKIKDFRKSLEWTEKLIGISLNKSSQRV